MPVIDIKHTTLLGRELAFAADRRDIKFFDRLRSMPSAEAAEELLVSTSNPLSDYARGEEVSWLPGQLICQRWAYFADAVDRVRAREGSLRVRRVVDAATWSTNEVARSLGVSIAAVQLLAASGRLSSTKVNGRTIFERPEVEAFELVRSGPSASRVPALYVTAGNLPSGEVMRVAVLDAQGVRAHGEVLSSRDTPRGAVVDLVFPLWSEAVIMWGTTGRQQGQLVTPRDGQVNRVALGPDNELGAAGRWALVEATSNRSRAAGMYNALLERAKEQS